MDKFLSNAQVYFEKKVIIVFLLGIAGGFPAVFTYGSVVSVWLRESGLDIKTIGLFALVGTAYNFKFLWAPFVDNIRLPLLSNKLGNRRAWLVLLLCLMALNLYFVGFIDPLQNTSLAALLIVCLAFLSATLDIVIDAYRIDILEENRQGAGASSYVLGYRLGYSLIGYSLILGIADYIGTQNDPSLWAGAFVFGGMVLLALAVVVLFSPAEEQNSLEVKDMKTWLFEAAIKPFKEFASREGWWMFLLFIMLFKLGDAFAGSLISVFYLDIGFDKLQLATVNKFTGFIATILGTLLVGIINYRINIIKLMWITGILMMVSNLVFCGLSVVGNNIYALGAAVFIENFTGGMGTAAFVAFISSLCSRRFTATQFALLTSLATVGRTFMNSSAGFIQEDVGWFNFFVFSTLIAIPGLVCLYIISKKYRSSILSD